MSKRFLPAEDFPRDTRRALMRRVEIRMERRERCHLRTAMHAIGED